MRLDEIKQNRLYDEFAYLWPLVSDPKNYIKEAGIWKKVLREKLGPGRHEILELGVGGGNNLSHLTADFKAVAVDLSDKMMNNSRKLNPDVEHIVGDMRTMRLGRKFKAVLIHDAINYMLTEDDLRAAFKTAREHLESGGVFITAPDYTAETFVDGVVGHDTGSSDRTRLVYIDYQFDPDPDDTTYEYLMIYIIHENGEVRIEHDRHISGLFPLKRWLELLAETGFAVEKYPYDVHEDGHESFLLMGIKK